MDSERRHLFPTPMQATFIVVGVGVAAALVGAFAPERVSDIAVGLAFSAASVGAVAACAAAALHARPPESRSWWLAASAAAAAAAAGLWMAAAGTAPSQLLHPVTGALTLLVSALLAGALVRLIPVASARTDLYAGWTFDAGLMLGATWLLTWLVAGFVGPVAIGSAYERAFASLYVAEGIVVVATAVAIGGALRSVARSSLWLSMGSGLIGLGIGLLPWWRFTAAPHDTILTAVVEAVWVAAAAAIGLAGLLRSTEPPTGATRLRSVRSSERRDAITAVLTVALLLGVTTAAVAAAVLAPWPVEDRRLTILAAVVLAAAIAIRVATVAMFDSDRSATLVTDKLTGLFNNRYLSQRLAEECAAAAETSTPLAVAMVDIDDFAAANVACGRDGGDAVLRSIGRRLGAEQGADLVAARTGGDEFTLIMPSTTAEQALDRVAAVTGFITAASLSECGVTASAGVAVWEPGPGVADPEPDTLLDRADRALYWVKYHGKDAVAAWDPRAMGERFDRARPTLADHRSLAAVVRSLAAANDARDAYRKDHSRNVARMSVQVGRALDLDVEILVRLENAALLHDIGLMCVPDAVLDLPRALDPQERELVEQHPEVGARLLVGTEMSDLAPIVAAHHERWDGTGYPSGLAGEEIPLEARIIAVCDTYDGVIGARAHHGARDTRTGIAALTEGLRGDLDPAIAGVLIDLLVSQEAHRW